MTDYESNLLASKPTKIDNRGGYEIRYLLAEEMEDFFGYALQEKVFVRNNLSKNVERFVICHEISHLKDGSHWLGWVGSEMRANVAAGVREPLGFLLTVRSSLNRRRLAKYWNLLTHPSKT